jgi:hypothetical protein
MRPRSRRARVAVATLVFGAVVGLSGALLHATTHRSASTAHVHAHNGAPKTPVLTSPIRPSETAAPDPVDPVGLQQHLDRMRHLQDPMVGPGEPPIIGEATKQPDLYAAEFVRRLLTQDYDRPRATHLAWVQAESTTTADSLVVGLVPPDLRDRFAVYSVTDTSDGPAPVPTAGEWAALAMAHGFSEATIDRVIEPTAWTNAVEAGRVTDPGTTARLVAATVTRHTTIAGQARTQTFSVAISLNLEGPPTRPDWRFVTAVTYTAIPMGGGS